VFHKPEFKGKVIDIETNKPIEGAVVVAIYRKEAIAVGDSVTLDFDAQETLTDIDGNFRIPSYTTVIQPLSWSIPTEFIFFKPGYVYDGRFGREGDFSGDRTLTDREFSASWNRNLKHSIAKTGIVKLCKVDGNDRLESYRNLSLPLRDVAELPITHGIEDKENKHILEFKKQLRLNIETKHNAEQLPARDR
jgi:hypothetical protein